MCSAEEGEKLFNWRGGYVLLKRGKYQCSAEEREKCSTEGGKCSVEKRGTCSTERGKSVLMEGKECSAGEGESVVLKRRKLCF